MLSGECGLAAPTRPRLGECLTPHRTNVYVEAFRRYRHLPKSLLRWYVRDLLAALPSDCRRRTIRFLDVGAGTGQFASALWAEAAAQGLKLDVTLLEPSPAFGDHLLQSALVDRMELIDAPVEQFAPPKPFDLVLLSEVAHLFESHEIAFDALHDVVADDGLVAMRFGSRSQVSDRNWYEFIPAAADVDLARAPVDGEYEELLLRRGFACSVEELDESRWLSFDERLGIVATKAYSSYCLVDDDAFALGVMCLADALERRTVSTCWEGKMTWMKARLQSIC